MRASSGESVTCAVSALAPLRRGSVRSPRRFAARSLLGRRRPSRECRARCRALVEQRRQHVFRRRLRVMLVKRARIGSVEPVADALRHLLYVHCSPIIQRVRGDRLQELPLQLGVGRGERVELRFIDGGLCLLRRRQEPGATSSPARSNRVRLRESAPAREGLRCCGDRRSAAT